jgi:integrase
VGRAIPAAQVKTQYPGIFKRDGKQGVRYLVRYWAHGEQKAETVRTLEEARRLKRSRETDVDRGEFQAESRIGFRAYAEEWIERYQGNGKRGFSEDTRDDYRRDLIRYAYPLLGDKFLSRITARDISNLIAWLCDAQEQGRRFAQERDSKVKPRPLTDATIRRILSPIRACLATARREGLIRLNPVDGAVLPHRPVVEEEGEEVRALSRDQLSTFLKVVHPRHRLLFRFLAATGLRWSELIGVRWRDLQLDGGEPCVNVRRAIVRGKVKPPKTKYGRRSVPLDLGLVSELRRWHRETEWPDAEALVFSALNGQPLRQENIRRRVLRPAAEEVDASWAGFHTFRHTVASLLFARGASAVQVQRWLGHHSPAFTLSVYVHLLPGDDANALDLGAELAPKVVHNLCTSGTKDEQAGTSSPAPIPA